MEVSPRDAPHAEGTARAGPVPSSVGPQRHVRRGPCHPRPRDSRKLRTRDRRPGGVSEPLVSGASLGLQGSCRARRAGHRRQGPRHVSQTHGFAPRCLANLSKSVVRRPTVRAVCGGCRLGARLKAAVGPSDVPRANGQPGRTQLPEPARRSPTGLRAAPRCAVVVVRGPVDATGRAAPWVGCGPAGGGAVRRPGRGAAAPWSNRRSACRTGRSHGRRRPAGAHG